MTESRETDQGSAAQHESPDSQVALSASAAQRFAESAVTPLSERRRPSAGDLGHNVGLKRTGAGKATSVPGGGGVPSAPQSPAVDQQATTVMPQRPDPLPRRSVADSEATTVMPQNPTAAPGRSAAFLPETTVMPQNPEIRPQRPVGGPQAPMGMGGRPAGGPQAPFAGGQAPASSPVGAARSLPLGEPLPQHPGQTRESPVGTQTTTADESTKAPSSVHTDRSIPLGETGPQWPEDAPNTPSAPTITQESATDATKESGPEAPSNPTPRTSPSSGSNTPVSSPSTGNAGEGQFSPRFQAFVESGPSMPGPKTAQYPTLAPRTAQVWSVPKPKKKPLPIFESVVAGAGAALMLVGVLGFLQASGPIVTVFIAILCIVPLAIVVSVLLFIDRFEPEPLGMKLAALAWGGGVSIFFGIMGNEYVQYSVTEQTGDEVQGMIFSVVVGAPVVEELLKGLGVLVIVWARRTHISSAIDGLVYAGFAACGFLVVEDFTYFVRAVLTDGDLGQTFFQRVVMGVFGHVMYTSCMGWATGWAVTRARSAAAGCGAVALGWFTGMLLHATWNGTAVLSGGDDELFDTFYIFIHVPLFLLWFLFIALAMKRERRDAAAGLMPYVAQGWIVPSEIQMVCDPRSRRAALAWASNGGPLAKKAMKQFMYALATLGLHQVVMKNRGPEQARIEESRELAKEATSQRKIFMKLTGMRRF